MPNRHFAKLQFIYYTVELNFWCWCQNR